MDCSRGIGATIVWAPDSIRWCLGTRSPAVKRAARLGCNGWFTNLFFAGVCCAVVHCAVLCSILLGVADSCWMDIAGRTMGMNQDSDITVIERHNYWVFTVTEPKSGKSKCLADF